MRDVVAPQQIVANADYPYGDRVARARELLERMGIRDVKPLYSTGTGMQRVANDSDPGAGGGDAEPSFDYWAGWSLRTAQGAALAAGNDHDGGR